MKKFLATLLAIAMLASLTACGGNDKPDTSSGNESSSTVENTNEIAPNVEDGTVGADVWNAFQSAVKENPDATPAELAELLCAHVADDFSATTTPIDPKWIPGFKDGYAPEGYAEGVSFGPMISALPFMGYIFNMKDDADVAAFVKALNDNANPRWNVCTEADQVVVGAIDKTVFFLMCPKSTESNMEDEESMEESSEESKESEESSKENSSKEDTSSNTSSEKPSSSKPASKPNKPASSKPNKPASSKPASKPSSSNKEDASSKEPSKDVNHIPSVEKGTMGADMWNAFAATVKKNPSASAESIASTLSSNKAIPYSCMSSPVNPEWIPGFNNGYAPKGYTAGATFGPMIGSIPFMGYVFTMEDAADTGAFVKSLKNNANPRWNVCTEADQVVVGSIGKTVFFLMCPETVEAE